MFFNQDILFKNGPLSILWMAGNEELRSKDNRGRRKKQFQIMLDSNLVQLCDLVRQQFGQMGTSKGMNLKKVATLVKGLGFIYFTKFDILARNINDMHLRLQVSATVRLRDIDLPTTTRVTAAALMINEAIGPMEDFGALHYDQTVDFSVTRFEREAMCSPRAHPESRMAEAYPVYLASPPREESSVRKERGRKRKRGRDGADDGSDEVNEATVLQMLKDTVAQNPRAHCLVEGDGINPTIHDNGFGFGGFNEEFDEQQQMQSETNIETREPLLQLDDTHHRDLSPPNRLPTPFDIGRKRTHNQPGVVENDDEELQDNVGVPQVPVVAESQQTLQLHSLEDDNQAGPHRGRRRSRRKLEVDAVTTIPLQQMLDGLNAFRRPLDYDALRLNMAQNQALPLAQFLRSKKGLNLIDNFGLKLNGRRLSTFVGSQLESLRKMPRHDLTNEVERPEATASGIEQSHASGNQQLEEAPIEPTMEQPRLEIDEVTGVQISEANVEEPELQIFQLNEEQDQFVDPFVDETGGMNNPDGRVSQRIEEGMALGQTTFRELFPTGNTSKKRAAVGFFQLLRLQSKKEVKLEQEFFFGEITVTPTPC